MYAATIANHFVASRKVDPFIIRWHQLFLHAWENRPTNPSSTTTSTNTNYGGIARTHCLSSR